MKMIDYNLLKGKITAMQSTEPEYAFNFLNNAQNPSTEWECIEDMIDSMEVYEAEPVKRGKWIWDSNAPYRDYGAYKCSNCGRHMDFEENYCPNCGARMEQEE